jgi:hypothetical protein
MSPRATARMLAETGADGGAASRRMRLRAPEVAALALVVLYFILVVTLAPGGPFGDDLDIARSVEAARAADNPWPALVSLHNEHRLVLTRLVFWGQQAVMGAPDYTMIALVGNLFLLAVFGVFAMRAREADAPAAGWAILFAAAMTFSYSAADTMLWAMGAVQNYGAAASAALAFWMLAKRGTGWTLSALAMAAVAVAAQGSGLVVLALGAVFLAVDRRWAWSAVWLAATVAVAIPYMSGATTPGGHSSFDVVMGQPLEATLFALIVSGSALGYPMENEGLRLVFFAACAGFGALLWGIVGRAVLRSRFASRDPILWFALFLIASGFLVATGRLEAGMIQALTPRYHTLSCLLAACCLLMLATEPSEARAPALVRRALPVLAVAAVAYVGVSTLTLWRMHVFLAEHVGTRGPALSGGR